MGRIFGTTFLIAATIFNITLPFLAIYGLIMLFA